MFVLTSLGRTVYALDEGGEVVWQVRTAGPVYTLAALEQDTVAVGDDAGFVSSLRADGQQAWRYDLGSRVTALDAWRGGMLAGGWDERLTSLGPEGQVHWQVDLGGPVGAIAALPELALASTIDGMIRAFDPGGAAAWHLDVGSPVTALGTVGEGAGSSILASTQDGRLLALKIDGTLRWQQSLDEGAEGSPVWHAADLMGDAAPEVIAGTGGSEPVLALLSMMGDVLWRITVPSPVGAIASGDLDGDGAAEILTGLANGEVQAYDAQGRRRGSVHAGLSVWGLEVTEGDSSGLIVDGTVLVRADVVAWRIAGVDGPEGGPWLPPPPMVPVSQDLVPLHAERAEGEAILTFLGDVAPGRSMEAQLARFGQAYPWEGIGPLMHEADLAAANLECLLTTQGRPLDKHYLMRAHPRGGQTLVEAGLDLVSLANNHALDYGQAGLNETLEALDSLGIAVVGAGRSQVEARRPALLTLNGLRVAVLGYAAARWNGSVDVPATDHIAWADLSSVQADVHAVRDQANIVVVLLHAGTEYAGEPSPDQVAVAHGAVDAGADLVVGHHPHVTQTVERYKQGLIVYSLGDALFDIPRPAAMQGDLLRVHVGREGLIQAELWPFWIDDAIRPRLLDDGQGEARFEIVYP
jgi:poly-gamma-glutamate synthesis protein (capsule biosynthesis protein)